MYSGKTAKFFSYLLPVLYRQCPNDNTHTIWDHYCNCCPGTPYQYLPSQRVWVDSPGAANMACFGSSYSYSSMLSPGEIFWPVIQQAFIIAGIGFTLLFLGFKMIEPATEQARDNMIKRQNAAAKE